MKRNVLFAIVVACAVIAGCKPRPDAVCATTPVTIHDKEVRYVPIDPRLTEPVRNPGPVLQKGAGQEVGDAVTSAVGCAAALDTVNVRLACIARVQGAPVPAGASTAPCGPTSPPPPAPQPSGQPRDP